MTVGKVCTKSVVTAAADEAVTDAAEQTAAEQPHRHAIECPVCQAHGELLRHDIRGSLVYFCQRCQHEWQIDPAEEPVEADLTVSPGPLTGQS